MKVRKTERGWAGHYILSHRCLFRRNTLLEFNDIKIVVSTVGNLYNENDHNIETVGANRYYETMAFHSDKQDIRFHDADVQKKISFDSNWCLDVSDADDLADIMHETVVNEITNGLLKGNRYDYYNE